MSEPRPPDLSARARPGAVFALRVTPRARRRALLPPETPGGPLRAHVPEPPEDGRATRAAARLLAEALGVAPSRLTLTRGARARDKLFRLT